MDRISPYQDKIAEMEADLTEEGVSMDVLGRIEATRNALEYIGFTDSYGAECSLQQSSAAFCVIKGVSAVWLGINHESVLPVGPEYTRMHLSRNHVKALVRVLNNWLERGSFYEATP